MVKVCQLPVSVLFVQKEIKAQAKLKFKWIKFIKTFNRPVQVFNHCKTIMKTYSELKQQEPILSECFFAFSNSQFDEGVKLMGIEGKKIFSGGGTGLYGTQEGIQKLMDYYDNQDKEIAEQCNPQDVYAYEFNNHECSYTCNDREAFAIVENIFGKEKASEVKRRFAYIETIND